MVSTFSDHLVHAGISGAPRLKDLARVTEKQLPPVLGKLDRVLKPDFQRFNLSFFRHPASATTWLGFRDGDIHDHDRWLFCIPDNASTWYKVLRERELHAVIHPTESESRLAELRLLPQLRSPGLISMLMDQLVSLDHSMAMEVDFMGATALPHHLLLHYSVMFPNLMTREVLELGEKWDLKELHDIVHHYEAWAADTEFEGMPQDLVLRMHRLHDFDPAPIKDVL
jgi:hypothetical protein